MHNPTIWHYVQHAFTVERTRIVIDDDGGDDDFVRFTRLLEVLTSSSISSSSEDNSECFPKEEEDRLFDDSDSRRFSIGGPSFRGSFNVFGEC